jgi:hypothetical protein
VLAQAAENRCDCGLTAACTGTLSSVVCQVVTAGAAVAGIAIMTAATPATPATPMRPMRRFVMTVLIQDAGNERADHAASSLIVR